MRNYLILWAIFSLAFAGVDHQKTSCPDADLEKPDAQQLTSPEAPAVVPIARSLEATPKASSTTQTKIRHSHFERYVRNNVLPTIPFAKRIKKTQKIKWWWWVIIFFAIVIGGSVGLTAMKGWPMTAANIGANFVRAFLIGLVLIFILMSILGWANGGRL